MYVIFIFLFLFLWLHRAFYLNEVKDQLMHNYLLKVLKVLKECMLFVPCMFLQSMYPQTNALRETSTCFDTEVPSSGNRYKKGEHPMRLYVFRSSI
jgi:hypothetical protein